METEMINVIVNAIRTKSLIKISYFPGERIVEPHAIGRSKDGNILLRAYQRSGASASGEHEYWKLFRIDRAGNIQEMGERFAGPRPKYNPDDSVMKGGIIARL
jgi:predicted DNA-binding transcriptional regulator YafY